jgi:uncharacterized protein YdaU (DUF1376 family)
MDDSASASRERKMKPPAFQFYPDAFFMGTATMSAEAVGGYIRLLCWQWDRGSVPNDRKELLKISGVRPRFIDEILPKFPQSADGLRRNYRLEIEREKQNIFREKQAAKAKKRWNGDAVACAGDDAAASSRHGARHIPDACSPSLSPSSSSISSPQRAPAVGESANDESGTEEGSDHRPGKPQSRIIPPLKEWVLAYGPRIMLSAEECEKFFDHYEGNGWRSGQGHVDDWQVKMRSWRHRRTEFDRKPTSPATTQKTAEAAWGISGGIGE